MDGYNITLLAYGQTGSGKTHTMFGDTKSLKKNQTTSDLWGLFPRTVNEILNRIDGISETGVLTATVVELYAGRCFDLINGRKRLGSGNWSGGYSMEGCINMKITG